jgi:MoaA/NifB/PqqE/SkfB family radical SAM enzyme
MHELIVSPFLGTHLVLRPGQPNAIKIPRHKYAQLQCIGSDESCPNWLSDAVMKSWGINISGRSLRDFAIVRRRGAWKSFMGGLKAAHAAGVPLDLSVVITKDNAHEVDAMHAMADQLGIKYRDYKNMVPTIYGGAESLPSQSLQHLAIPEPFTGCDAGHTSFHVDPLGKASICKVGREPNIALVDEGIEGLYRLGIIADQLLQREGGCTGCTLSAQCGTCMPLAAKYRQANAPLNRYCQHTERG